MNGITNDNTEHQFDSVDMAQDVRAALRPKPAPLLFWARYFTRRHLAAVNCAGIACLSAFAWTF